MSQDLAAAQICRHAPWPLAVLSLYGTGEGASSGQVAGVNKGMI
jgi:hypothetical protein